MILYSPNTNANFSSASEYSMLMFCSQSDDEHGGPGLQHGQTCVELLLVP